MSQIQMGLAGIGQINTAFKRKWRWTFQLTNIGALTAGTNSISPYFVKISARPNLNIEETELNYLNGKTWIPGKGTWQTINVTFLDVVRQESLNLFQWIKILYDFTNPAQLNQATVPQDYAATGVLTMYDGGGNPVEVWTLGNVWPTSVNWGDLDYASNDVCEIALTLRYSQVSYTFCGGQVPAVTLTPACSTSTATINTNK